MNKWHALLLNNYVFEAKCPGVLLSCLLLFFVYQIEKIKEGYCSPAQVLKYSRAGLNIPGENVIDDVPFLKKFWLNFGKRP